MSDADQLTGVKPLAGKVAIVTGAGQGLGATFATELARAGASIVIGDISSTEETYRAIESIRRNVAAVRLDVTDGRSVAAMVDVAIRQFGSVDILVNNAAISGILKLQPLTEISSDDWDRVLAVNTRGTFECIKAVVQPMKKAGYGKIINLASGTAIKGSPGLAHYVASKGAVISLTRAAARELGDFGIRVNAIAPGLTMSAGILNNASWNSDVVSRNVATRAIKREVYPEDLIGTLLFMASPASDFMTGQTICVDGGSVMI
ncbi:SDR family NAD(P)-dependent oxidoreductase [Bradyrhizobium vignae]|uniref:PsfG n=1 Tax=Bradyrhizobium vignae TaxID=1549949 RepID=A0A2U3PUQ3_9BRAD|nr:SDR family oxidoreductase [Bradyrhizobium vignae]SPP92890.1 PsfG [Bradyrhizobium vignae]